MSRSSSVKTENAPPRSDMQHPNTAAIYSAASQSHRLFCSCCSSVSMLSYFSRASWLKTRSRLLGPFEPRHFSPVMDGSKGILNPLPSAAPTDPFLSSDMGQKHQRTRRKSLRRWYQINCTKCQFSNTTRGVYKSHGECLHLPLREKKANTQ